MTISERRKIRSEILAHEVDKAYFRASIHRRSAECVAAMQVMNADPDQARKLHASCEDENHPGPGCLCECHDTRDTAVVTGFSG
jgi:hypothetical protein